NGTYGVNLAYYDSNGILGPLWRVTDRTSGQYLEFAYDSNNRLATLCDSRSQTPSGQPSSPQGGCQTNISGAPQVIYNYDSKSNLHTVKDARGGTWTYTYEDLTNPAFLTKVIDPDQKIVEQQTYTYGRLTAQKDGLSQVIVNVSYPYWAWYANQLEGV